MPPPGRPPPSTRAANRLFTKAASLKRAIGLTRARHPMLPTPGMPGNLSRPVAAAAAPAVLRPQLAAQQPAALYPAASAPLAAQLPLACSATGTAILTLCAVKPPLAGAGRTTKVVSPTLIARLWPRLTALLAALLAQSQAARSLAVQLPAVPVFPRY